MINFFKLFGKKKFEFNEKSKQLLELVHPDLKSLVYKALELCDIQFQVYYGVRTIEEQIELFNKGKSKTLNSRHLHKLAVDLYSEIEPNKANWDAKNYKTINDAFTKASAKLNIQYTWGGNFTSFKDYNHFELAKTKYPDNINIVKELKNRKLIK